MSKYLFCIVTLIAFSTGCNQPEQKPNSQITLTPPVDSVKSMVAPVINSDSLLLETGKSILLSLKNKNYQQLIKHFATDKKVRFTPYGHVDIKNDVQLNAAEFLKLLTANKKIMWGFQDGSGDSMQLTIPEYFQRFVYNVDFLKAERTAIDSIIGKGNSLNNLKSTYKSARFIEYHFPGFDKKYAGMDWTSLRLVFEKEKNGYFLIAVIHDQWTI